MENTHNKIKGIIVASAIVAGLIALAQLPVWKVPVISDALWFLKVLALGVIVRNGLWRRMRFYHTLLSLCIAVVILGALFKIMH